MSNWDFHHLKNDKLSEWLFAYRNTSGSDWSYKLLIFETDMLHFGTTLFCPLFSTWHPRCSLSCFFHHFLHFLVWWQSVTISALTASQRPSRLSAPPGNQSSEPGSIPKDCILDRPLTRLAETDWWGDSLPHLDKNNIQSSAHTQLTCRAAQTLTCTNTLTPEYRVISLSETNTYKCVCPCEHEYILIANLQCPLSHWICLAQPSVHPRLWTNFGLPQSLTASF